MTEVGISTLQRPRQAVILAGGQGTRLRPLSDIRPKAMIEIHGRPFLEEIVEMLKDQGFEEVLMLLGYLPEVVQDYFQDGSKWGLKISYSVTPVENNTGRRLKACRTTPARLLPSSLLRQLLADADGTDVEMLCRVRCRRQC